MDEPPNTPAIVEIRSVARGRQRLVVLTDGREFIFSDEACERAAVAVGDAATAAVLETLDGAEHRVNAHEAALRLLSHRARSETEMRTRLAMRGIEPAAVVEEIQRLQRAGLLDDEKFARAWVEDRRRLAPRGRRMLRYELLGRGIELAAVEQVTQDIDDREVAIQLAHDRARRASTSNYDSFAAKVGGFLRRRGFDYDVTAHATRLAWEATQKEQGGAADEPLDGGP
ncbi:MAG: regulatory protein RecX [Tepidiformaceae bacterium]